MEPLSEQTRQDLASGRRTMAQLLGITAEQGDRYLRTACELAEAGRLDEARRILEGLCLANPRDASAQAALGTVLERLGRCEDALEMFDAALAQVPTHPVALANRGELRLRLGDVGGRGDLEAAVREDPKLETCAARRASRFLDAIRATAAAPPTSAAPGGSRE